MQMVPLPAMSALVVPEGSTTTAKRREMIQSREKMHRQQVTGSTAYVLASTIPKSKDVLMHEHPEYLGALLSLLIILRLMPQGQALYPDLLETMSGIDAAISDDKEHPILRARFNDWLDMLRQQRYVTRVNANRSDLSEEQDYIYGLGPRAVLEFPPESMRGFIKELAKEAEESESFMARVDHVFSTADNLDSTQMGGGESDSTDAFVAQKIPESQSFTQKSSQAPLKTSHHAQKTRVKREVVDLS